MIDLFTKESKTCPSDLSDGSETPLWVQDYWVNITRANKDQTLIRMLEASVQRDMTAENPAWVINYPSAYIDGPFSDNYRKNAESTNQCHIGVRIHRDISIFRLFRLVFA